MKLCWLWGISVKATRRSAAFTTEVAASGRHVIAVQTSTGLWLCQDSIPMLATTRPLLMDLKFVPVQQLFLYLLQHYAFPIVPCTTAGKVAVKLATPLTSQG